MNFNKVIIAGRVTADPQMRSTPTGQHVANFGVATNRVWYNASQQKQESVEFHNIVVWGKQAEVAAKFLKKGGLVLVDGRLQTRSWQDKSGAPRKTTEIVAERIQLGPRAGGGGGGNVTGGTGTESPVASQKEPEVPTINVDEEINPEDLPF